MRRHWPRRESTEKPDAAFSVIISECRLTSRVLSR
jgi:hypothetical protein